MDAQIFGKKDSNETKKALRFFKERRIKVHFVDLDQRPAAAGELGALLSGRVTHQLMAEFWPTADKDPASTGPMVEFARIWRDMPKFVFSRTLERADWNTTIVREVVPEEIQKLKEQPGGDMV